jgi:hypothetical protein
MKKVHDRFHRPQELEEGPADVPLAKFRDRYQNSRRYHVTPSGNGIFQVQIPDSGWKYIVNLPEHECDCTNFWEYESPCTHAIIACRHQGEDPYKHMNPRHTVMAYRATYQHFLKPMSIENLPSDPNILPPIAKK